MKCALCQAAFLAVLASAVAWVDLGRRPPLKMEVVGVQGEVVTAGSDETKAPATSPRQDIAKVPPAVDSGNRPDSPAATPAPTVADYIEVTAEAAFKAYADGFTTFIDARSAEEYAEGHVPDALLMPPSAFYGGKIPAAINDLSHEDAILVYCGGGDCDASHEVVKRLRLLGFTNLYVLPTGVPGWAEAGYDTSTDPPPNSGG